MKIIDCEHRVIDFRCERCPEYPPWDLGLYGGGMGRLVLPY
jgi:hypothetical protein